MKYESGISVCITAYKAKEFIKETLDSVAAQTWFKTHDNWEVIVGVDGCRETLEYLTGIADNYRNLNIYMMDSNKGTYVTTNTIMSLARYDGLIRFDSDDLMLPRMVEKIMAIRKRYDVIKFKMRNFGSRDDAYVACGQIYMRHTTFDEFGGYKPWVCGADSDFFKRVSKFVRVKVMDDILFNRRVHDGSLTTSKSTGGGSSTRRKYAEMIRRMDVRSKNDAVISRETNSCKEIRGGKETATVVIGKKPSAAKNDVKKKKPAAKGLSTKSTKYNKERPGGKGWSEFFGL